MPINVTHTAIATSAVQERLLSINASSSALRHTLSTLITFFADSYKSTFGFVDGPPLHDALTVAYISRPDLFRYKRYRVDVELGGTHTSGETVVDVWNYRCCDQSWGPLGKNCLVVQSVDVIIPASLSYLSFHSSLCVF
jgi:uridine nucleosidase